MVLAISIYFLAALLPSALNTFFNTDTTGWDTGTVALWLLIPLAIVAGVALIFVPKGGRGE